jgi:flagellar motility protein MotE (MotC chaperone)
MKSVFKHVRLLPAVLAAGTVLLVVKGFGLVHGAEAQTQPGIQVASATSTAPKDFASDDRGDASAAEVDVLTSLSKRRAELDARARDQAMRENILAATEKRVDDKIAALKQLQTQMTTLLGQRDTAQEKQVTSLVKTYSSMKPKDAARIFDGLSDDVLVPVAQAMKSDALAPVLAAMNPSSAQKLTVKLASRLTLPQTASAPTPPVAVPPPAVPGSTPQQTEPVPAPEQQANATPQKPASQQVKTPAPQAAAPQTTAPQAPGAHG